MNFDFRKYNSVSKIVEYLSTASLNDRPIHSLMNVYNSKIITANKKEMLTEAFVEILIENKNQDVIFLLTNYTDVYEKAAYKMLRSMTADEMYDRINNDEHFCLSAIHEYMVTRDHVEEFRKMSKK